MGVDQQSKAAGQPNNMAVGYIVRLREKDEKRESERAREGEY